MTSAEERKNRVATHLRWGEAADSIIHDKSLRGGRRGPLRPHRPGVYLSGQTGTTTHSWEILVCSTVVSGHYRTDSSNPYPGQIRYVRERRQPGES